MLTPALSQLPRARIAASACVTYLALLEMLDANEYRPVTVDEVCTITGYRRSSVYEALELLRRAGFLDCRGESPRKYRILLSRRLVSTTRTLPSSVAD